MNDRVEHVGAHDEARTLRAEPIDRAHTGKLLRARSALQIARVELHASIFSTGRAGALRTRLGLLLRKTADAITPDGERPFVRVADLTALQDHGDRVHVHLGGRHVSLINHHGEVYCLDSLCYHAGGPLAVGDIEDVGGKPCLSCPWHLYKVTLDTGEKLYGATRFDDDGTLVPDGVKSAGVRQRTHEVERRPDGWYVRLRLDGEVESDKYARKDVPGIDGAYEVRVA